MDEGDPGRLMEVRTHATTNEQEKVLKYLK